MYLNHFVTQDTFQLLPASGTKTDIVNITSTGDFVCVPSQIIDALILADYLNSANFPGTSQPAIPVINVPTTGEPEPSGPTGGYYDISFSYNSTINFTVFGASKTVLKTYPIALKYYEFGPHLREIPTSGYTF